MDQQLIGRLIGVGKKMRAAQKTARRLRQQWALSAAQALEEEFDILLEHISPEPKQDSLFPTVAVGDRPGSCLDDEGDPFV